MFSVHHALAGNCQQTDITKKTSVKLANIFDKSKNAKIFKNLEYLSDS